METFETYSISTVSTSYPLFHFEFTTNNAVSSQRGYVKITYPAELELDSPSDLKIKTDSVTLGVNAGDFTVS